MFKRSTQATRLDPHNRIRLRIEVLAAAENRGGDSVGLDPVGAPFEGFLHRVS